MSEKAPITKAREIASILCETDPDQVVVAVVLFDGHNWMIRTVAPPDPEMMADLKSGLKLLAAQFERDGF